MYRGKYCYVKTSTFHVLACVFTVHMFPLDFITNFLKAEILNLPLLRFPVSQVWNFPDGSDSRESACNAGDPGSFPELGRSPGEGNGNRLQYSCLENPMNRDGGTWWVTVHGVAKS